MQDITSFKLFGDFSLYDKNSKMLWLNLAQNWKKTHGNIKTQSLSKQNVEGRAHVKVSLPSPCLPF